MGKASTKAVSHFIFTTAMEEVGAISRGGGGYGSQRQKSFTLLAFCLSSTLQLPGNSQVGKGAVTSPPLFFSLALFSSSPPHAYGQPASSPPLSLPFFVSTTLLTPLPMPRINSILYYTIHRCVVGSSGGRDALAWACRGISYPHTSIEHIPPVFIFLETHPLPQCRLSEC